MRTTLPAVVYGLAMGPHDLIAATPDYPAPVPITLRAFLRVL